MSHIVYKHAGNGEVPMKKNYDESSKSEKINKGSFFVREQFSTACRICHSVISSEKLISPCLCKGSLAFVHLSCLERWLNQSGRDTCELCTFRFEAEQTRRYSVYQGLRIWYRHPRHNSQLKADLIIGLVLTGVTLGLCSICLGGMKYFVLEGFRVGISYVWTEGVISFFLIVIVIGYFTTIYLMLRDHFVPWFNWWSRCVNVRLILDMDMIPAVDPQLITLNSSTELVQVPSEIPSLKPSLADRHDFPQSTQIQNALVLIPDISSTSVTMPPASRGRMGSIPSVMSAVMSHICTSAIVGSCQHQQRPSKENTDEENHQKPQETENSSQIGLPQPVVQPQLSVGSQTSSLPQRDEET